MVEEEDPTDEAAQELDELPYYVCNFAEFAGNGQCTRQAACGNQTCFYLAHECLSWGHNFDQYAIIVDGTCACYHHCDVNNGGGGSGY